MSEKVIVQDGEVFVNTKFLLELTDSEEFKVLSGEEFAGMVRLAMGALELVVKN